MQLIDNFKIKTLSLDSKALAISQVRAVEEEGHSSKDSCRGRALIWDLQGAEHRFSVQSQIDWSVDSCTLRIWASVTVANPADVTCRHSDELASSFVADIDQLLAIELTALEPKTLKLDDSGTAEFIALET